MNSLKNLKIKIFADGANVKEMVELNKSGIVQGFTTNPTLMRKDGVNSPKKFLVKYGIYLYHLKYSRMNLN